MGSQPVEGCDYVIKELQTIDARVPWSCRSDGSQVMTDNRLSILPEKCDPMGALGALLIVVAVAAIIIGIAYWFFYGRGPSR
jgi:hypothetical protein